MMFSLCVCDIAALSEYIDAVWWQATKMLFSVLIVKGMSLWFRKGKIINKVLQM